MSPAVVDTDIVSFAFKGDPRADACLHFLVGHTLYRIAATALLYNARWSPTTAETISVYRA